MFIYVIVCFVYGECVLSKTHADKIREAIQELDVASPNEIMNWIRIHYPDDPVNPSSYRADIIGCSVNHSSSHHYPSMPKFLWFIEETKKYRLARDDEAEIEYKIAPTPTRESEKSEVIDGVHVSELSITGQLYIPAEIREKLSLEPGDKIGFITKESGSVEIKKARVRLTFE